MSIVFEKKPITQKIDFRTTPLNAEYENVLFKNCLFREANLTGIIFRKCTFDGCDFSGAIVKDTTFDDATFTGSKLLGFRFDHCNDFLMTLRFENCLMKLASFHGLTLKKTTFLDCNLSEADFAEADFSESIFGNCDFHGTIFGKTNLEKSDLRTSFGYIFDPELNRLKKAKLSLPDVVGLLTKYDLDIR